MGAKSGLPPSVLVYEEFWSRLLQSVTIWAGEYLNANVPGGFESRLVYYGPALTEKLSENIVYFFSARSSPGLCAISLSQPVAGAIIAKRLGQELDGNSETSALFTRLMCEAPAVSLWRRAAECMPGHRVQVPESPVCEPAMCVGGLEPTSRYLALSYRTHPELSDAQVCIVLSPDYVTERAHEALVKTADPKPHSPSRILHDSALGSHINVDAVLDQISMTIGDCSRIKVGDVISLADPSPGMIRLQAETMNGQMVIGRGEMGVWKRNRAFRLRECLISPPADRAGND